MQEIAHLERDTLSPATLGLTLAEAKTLLHTLQTHLVEHQVAAYDQQQQVCPHCQQLRRIKDQRQMVYRSREHPECAKTLLCDLQKPYYAVILKKQFAHSGCSPVAETFTSGFEDEPLKRFSGLVQHIADQL